MSEISRVRGRAMGARLRAKRPSWTANVGFGRLARAATVPAILGALLAVAPATPAAAAVTASVALEVDRTEALSGDSLSYTAGFEVSGGTLQNAQVTLTFPREEFRYVGHAGGGIGA